MRGNNLLHKWGKRSRDGFSLVELIIVIAIMAILIGVIALAVIPNIQRSRESKDITKLDNIMSAANIAVAQTAMKSGEKAIVNYAAGTGAMTFDPSTPSEFQKAYVDSIGDGAIYLESGAASSSGIKVTVSVDSNNEATITVTSDPVVTLSYTTDDKGNDRVLKLENKTEIDNSNSGNDGNNSGNDGNNGGTGG